VLTLTLMFTGCSVDMFAGSKPDGKITGRESYRAIRPECSGLKITRPELDPKSLRALIDCFGSNGSLPEISNLIHDASDRTIRQTVDLLNSTFLADPSVRADSRGIVRSLKKSGHWDPTLAGFAPAFADANRMRALIHLLSLGNRDPLVVKTVQGFDAHETLAGFELLSRLVKTPAFASLSQKIQASPLTLAERDRLTEILLDLFKRPTAKASAKLLFQDMSAGKSAPFWTFAFGDGAGMLEASSRFNLLLHDFAGENGLKPLSLLHRGFQHPVACWGDGKIFPEPWHNLSHELGVHAAAGDASLLGFVGRFAPLTALAVPDICSIPDEFLEYYPSIMRLTAGRTGGEYLGVLSHIFSADFGDSAGYFVGEWGVPLTEALTILSTKPWFEDVVLLFGELDSSDRDLFASWMKALLANQKSWTALAATFEKSDLDPVFSDLGQVFGYAPSDLGAMLDSIRDLFESARLHPWFEGWKKIAAESDSDGMQSLADLKSFPDAASAIGRMAEDGRLAAILGDILELLAGGGREEKTTANVELDTVVQKTPRHLLVGTDLRPIETRAPLDDSLRACAKLDLRKSPRDQWDIYQACLAGGGVDLKAFAGLRAGEDWTVTDGEASRSILDSLVMSAVSLPISTADKHALIALITGKVSGVPALSSDRVRAAAAELQTRIDSGPNGSPTALFRILNRLQSALGIGVAVWQDFFTKLEKTIEDSRFVTYARALRTLIDPAIAGDSRIAPAPLPPAAETAAWVHDLECESDARVQVSRTAEIGREFSTGVLGWERPGGKIPLTWNAELLQPRLRAFASTLASSGIRANLYSWLGSVDPKLTAKWFADRASDPELVAVMDPETKQLRVRWMTSLDRLESILVNSNFTYLLNGNYGLKFIGKFAEAWGDEPRSRWPLEIQEKYSGRRTPPTLADAYAEVLTFLKAFERFGGIPTVPNCVVKDGAIAKAAFEDPWASAPDLFVPFSVKAKAFNLKQTLSVIRENLPGSGTAHADGMRLLRDLFWSIYSSAPPSARDPGKAETNPLRFLQAFGDLGGLRSVSRGLQTLDLASERLALEDAFGGLQIAVREPALDRLVAKVVADPEGIDSWVANATSAPSFRFGTLAFGAFDALAADRTLRSSPALLRFVDSILGDPATGALPNALIADALVAFGKSGVADRLTTLRLPPNAARDSFSGFGDFLDTRLFTAIRSFPVREATVLLDHDPALRGLILEEAERWLGSSPRQSLGDSSNSGGSAFLDLFLSTEHPEVRRAIGLWCGKSASRYAFEFTSHPDESLLIADGLLQSVQSAEFSDFLDSLLREVAN
jgi:hypothetical protein